MFRHSSVAFGAAALAAMLAAAPAVAGSAWDEVRPAIFGDTQIADGTGIVELVAPYRAVDDRRVPMELKAAFRDGRTVKAITLVIDENPVPEAARFEFGTEPVRVRVGADFRLNGPSPVHAVVEASDGQLYAVAAMVKSSGLGACAAPPVTGLEQAIASLGQMDLKDVTEDAGNASRITRTAELNIRHPNITGLQKDQLTLLYIPARYIAELSVKEGANEVFTLKSSIALSEDPRLWYDYRMNGAAEMTVSIVDTDGAAFEKAFPLGAGS